MSNNNIIGKVKAIKISEKKGQKKQPVSQGMCIADFGLEGDIHGGKGIRQVSFLSVESSDKIPETGIKGFCSGKFVENITTEDIQLHKLPLGTKLKIGESLQEITQIGKECHDGCPVKAMVGQCSMTKEGVFSRVIQGGKVQVGDSITIFE